MTDFKTSDRDVNRAIRSWLREDRHEDVSRIAGAVLSQAETTPQRRTTWWPARRTSTMNKMLTIGLGAAAVVVLLIVGYQVFSSPSGGLGADATATATSEPTPEPTLEATPSPTPEAGLPEGPYVVTQSDDPVQVTVDIASPGWSPAPELDYVFKNDDGLDAPESVGAALLAWAWPAGTGFNVYGDACQWSTTAPETPATTPDEIAAAFAAQAPTDATPPVDVTVGGYAGKKTTLHVPMSFEVPGATREEVFADCDENVFVSYGTEEEAVSRNHQGAGQVDELWILDVDGSIVILDASYSPATPADLIEELRNLAESAAFEAP